MFFSFQFYKQPNILTSNIKELRIKKKEKGQLSNTIKKSRADRSSRQKHLPPCSTLLTSTRNIPKVTYKDQIRIYK